MLLAYFTMVTLLPWQSQEEIFPRFLTWEPDEFPRDKIHQSMGHPLRLCHMGISLASPYSASNNPSNLPLRFFCPFMVPVASVKGSKFHFWFSGFTFLFRFWDSSLPCILNSMMSPRNVTGFSVCSDFSNFKNRSDHFQALYVWELQLEMVL